MKKVIFCVALSLVSTGFAEEKSETPAAPQSNESSPEPSIADRVIELIVEAATGNRDFGKDISDR